jgi:hypothetical protein
MTREARPSTVNNAPSGFFASTLGQVLGVLMALVVRYFVEFSGEMASYYPALAFYGARPRRQSDPGADLLATGFSLHGGAEAGRVVGIVVYVVLFLAASRKWGWRSLVVAFVGAMVAAAIAGYVAGLSPD